VNIALDLVYKYLYVGGAREQNVNKAGTKKEGAKPSLLLR